MKKEILTKENINEDLKKHFLGKSRDLLLIILITPLANAVILNAVLLFYNPGYSFKITFSIIF